MAGTNEQILLTFLATLEGGSLLSKSRAQSRGSAIIIFEIKLEDFDKLKLEG
jgi:hypothetical protein